jgi:hypothetical protein
LPGPNQGSETIINSMTTYTDACGDTYFVLAGDFSNLTRPGDSPIDVRPSARIALYGKNKADVNFDGFVDFFDYDDFVSCYEGSGCPAGVSADFNCDGFVDFFDYGDFVLWFEQA